LERHVTAAAIVGLGITELGKVYGHSTEDFAVTAIHAAVTDAGLTLGQVDGLLLSSGMKQELNPLLAGALGLHELSLCASVNSFGASSGVMVGAAARAIADGVASTVVCVFADAPLRETSRAGAAYSAGGAQLSGFRGAQAAGGAVTPNLLYAMAARRHMETYGTTTEQLGTIAVGAWRRGSFAPGQYFVYSPPPGGVPQPAVEPALVNETRAASTERTRPWTDQEIRRLLR
jgi:acetyl-CoA acetyltransferase